MNGKDIAVIAVFCTAIVGMLLRPLAVAYARRLSSSAADGDLAREVAELRDRVAELEAEHGRMMELEERLDFAERMLAQRVDVTALPINRTPA